MEFSPEDLKEIARLLKRKQQIENLHREIDDKIETLERQKKATAEELAEIQDKIGGDYKDLLRATKELLDIARPEPEGFKVYNPKYVTNQDKEKLLAAIIDDYRKENPEAKTISFKQVKAILLSRYNIETRTIGDFFRRQLPDYVTMGGNKKKVIDITKSSLTTKTGD